MIRHQRRRSCYSTELWLMKERFLSANRSPLAYNILSCMSTRFSEGFVICCFFTPDGGVFMSIRIKLSVIL